MHSHVEACALGAYLWRTVGSSTDVIEASWLALADSLEYWLHKHGEGVM